MACDFASVVDGCGGAVASAWKKAKGFHAAVLPEKGICFSVGIAGPAHDLAEVVHAQCGAGVSAQGAQIEEGVFAAGVDISLGGELHCGGIGIFHCVAGHGGGGCGGGIHMGGPQDGFKEQGSGFAGGQCSQGGGSESGQSGIVEPQIMKGGIAGVGNLETKRDGRAIGSGHSMGSGEGGAVVMSEIDGFLQLESRPDYFHMGGILVADGIAVWIDSLDRGDMGKGAGDNGSHGRGEETTGGQCANENGGNAERRGVDCERIQIGCAIVFDDEAKRRGSVIRGLEGIGAGTGGTAVLSAIDRELDVDAGNELDHLGGIVVGDEDAVRTLPGHGGGVAQVATDYRIHVCRAHLAAGQGAEDDGGDAEGNILDFRVGYRGGAGVGNRERIGDGRAIRALNAFDAGSRSAVIMAQIDCFMNVDGRRREAFNGLA